MQTAPAWSYGKVVTRGRSRSLAKCTIPKAMPRTGQFRISDYSVDERVRLSWGWMPRATLSSHGKAGATMHTVGGSTPSDIVLMAPLGGRFVVNSYQAGYQSSAAVAMTPIGEFVITWQDEMNGGAMFAQRYDASGIPQGGQFQVNSRPGSITSYGRVAMDAAETSWRRGEKTPPATVPVYAVFARRFAADGTPMGDDFRVNLSNTGYDGSLPQVAMNAQGESVITWVGRTADGGFNVYAQCFTPTGGALETRLSPRALFLPISWWIPQ